MEEKIVEAKVILIANVKGGAGKSTTANHLAHAAKARGVDSCVIDFDPIRTLYSQGQRLELDVPIYKADLKTDVGKIKDYDHTYVFVDIPSGNAEAITRISLIADEVIVPIAPTGYDIDVLGETTSLVTEVANVRNTPLLSILLTQYKINTRSSQETIEALNDVAEQFPMLDSRIRHLEVYRKYQKPKKLDEYIAVLRELELI